MSDEELDKLARTEPIIDSNLDKPIIEEKVKILQCSLRTSGVKRCSVHDAVASMVMKKPAMQAHLVSRDVD